MPLLTLRHYDQELLSHSHEHSQVVFALRGDLQLEVAGQESLMAPQMMAVIPPSAVHACGSPQGSDCLVLDVPSESWLSERLGRHADASRSLLEQNRTCALSARQGQLINWLANSPINDPLIAEQGTILLLASLTAEVRSEPHGLPMAAITAYIDQHLAHPLQVHDLARISGLSTARFHARFLAENSITPMDFVRQRRLQQGRQLLISTQLSVHEVAEQTGYSSQSAFTAALSRHCDMTPRQLRRLRE
ncbi:AraC family transcriptional regulator [Pseudomonas sp. J237]|nr:MULTISPECIES: AraC family transcriptional regulator [Pseudomonas]OEO24315.1 AraC family transcriptional regulator [Pseudomonas sp. J237]